MRKFSVAVFQSLYPLGLHSLKTLVISRVDFFDLNAEIFHPVDQFRAVQFAVASSRLQNLRLLLLREVLPLKIRSHMFLEKRQDLVMGDGARIRKIVNPRVVGRGEQESTW